MDCGHSASGAAITVRQIRGRTIAHYLIDLLVSVSLVVIAGWAVQAIAGDTYLHATLDTQSQLYRALSRFTPANLLHSYGATIQSMTQDLNPDSTADDGLTLVGGKIFAAIGGALIGICLAAPTTLFELYRQTDGAAGWIVLSGFGITIAAVLGWLLASRVSLWRVLLAAAISPLAVSVVFLALQSAMVLLYDAFFWLAWLAPYAIACPVVCALYWVAFPGADRGATAALAHAIGRVLESPRR
jgi:hypothetical protein